MMETSTFLMVSKVIIIVEYSQHLTKSSSVMGHYCGYSDWSKSIYCATNLHRRQRVVDKGEGSLWLFVVALLTGCAVLSSTPHPPFHGFSDIASARHKA